MIENKNKNLMLRVFFIIKSFVKINNYYKAAKVKKRLI